MTSARSFPLSSSTTSGRSKESLDLALPLPFLGEERIDSGDEAAFALVGMAAGAADEESGVILTI